MQSISTQDANRGALPLAVFRIFLNRNCPGYRARRIAGWDRSLDRVHPAFSNRLDTFRAWFRTAGLLGWRHLRPVTLDVAPSLQFPIGHRSAIAAWVLFFGLLMLLPIAVRMTGDHTLALVAFALLIFWKQSPLRVVVFTALGAAAIARF